MAASYFFSFGYYICFTDSQLYKAALGNCFESEEWGPIEYCIMAKHFERQGKDPYAYHAVSSRVLVMDYKFGCIIVDGEVKRTSNSVLNRASFYE